MRSVRDRLVRFMNSDIIRINDINYMNQLSQKIQTNFQVCFLNQIIKLCHSNLK